MDDTEVSRDKLKVRLSKWYVLSHPYAWSATLDLSGKCTVRFHALHDYVSSLSLFAVQG